MRIALTHPSCWPYVRRGAERFVDELACYLTRRGHDVITISAKPGAGVVERTPNGRRILHRQLWIPPMSRVRITPSHTFPLGLARTLMSLNVDVVQSLAYFDACTANLLRRIKGFRTVYQVIGPPVPYWFPRIPPDRFALRRAILDSNGCMAHSEFTRRIIHESYGVDAKVIPVPIDLGTFSPKTDTGPDPPIIVSMASFDDRRKGLRVLVDAFRIVRDRVPGAVLKLSGHLSPALREKVIDPLPDAVREGVEVLGVGQLGDLPRLYREASLTVLPSMWEVYGMTIVESWASGTPVVVTDHGGPSELVDDPALGCVFDPQTDGHETRNAEGLADAIAKALPLADDPATATRCRAKAERFEWDRVGPEYEKLLASR